ncbi:MAG: hypothetical protein HZA80_00030, partial [Candidatus Taylorbacteria bacterium]|nr:hypothetical protein [Candidatus Taylorbacteria bacterium]
MGKAMERGRSFTQIISKFKKTLVVTTIVATFFSIFPVGLTSNFVYAAGVPSIVSYQGRLADSNGDLLGGSGTTYYFKYSLWDNSTVGSGSRVWPAAAPTSYPLTVRQGVFTANIGDTAAGFPDVLDYDFNTSSDVYLQVEVSADGSSFQTLSPRQRISAAPFARLSAAVSGSSTPSSFGTTSPFGTSVVSIEATSTRSTALSLRSVLNQIANVFQVQDSTGSNVVSIDSTGAINTSSSLTVAGLTNLGRASSTILSALDSFSVGRTATTTIRGEANATSTFAGGIEIGSGCISVNGSCILGGGGSGITTLNGLITTSQNFATSSDTNIGLTITSSGSTHTYTSTWSGTLAPSRGGTGLGSVTANGILIGNAAGTGYTSLATSSLGLLSTDIAEGSNLYFTSNRVAGVIAGTTTDALAEGINNLYWTNTRFDNRLSGTTTLPNVTTLLGLTNTITTNATTTNATSTTFKTNTLGVGSDYITDITGSGLVISGGALSVSLSGDWTGTFDGQEGSYYLDARNLTNFGTPFYTYFNGTTTDALAQGSTNKY